MTNGTLLIDQRSASMAASDADLRLWARGKRVFVSSLIGDMKAERAAAREAIEAFGATAVMFEEELGAQDITAEQAYIAGVRTSEIYIGLFGPRYGVRMGDGSSATHAELMEAEKHGLRLCLFVNGETSGEMDRAQRDLVDGARNLYTTSSWTDPDDLRRRVERRLRDLASEDLSPWTRVGRAIFRAKEFGGNGQTLTVTADILDSAVHGELVRLRDGRGTVQYTSPHESRTVQVAELHTRSTSSARFEETLTLVVGQDGTYPQPMGSINGVSATEVFRRQLSDGLFGTTLLGDEAHWGSRPLDPLAEIRGLSLDDAVLRPVARLLCVEKMLSGGHAARVDQFTLGPSHQGRRRLSMVWTPRQVYSDVPDPEQISLEGVIADL